MNEIAPVARIVDRLKALEGVASPIAGLPAAAEVSRRLTGLQLELGLGLAAAGPVVIGLLGGTGVGKSHLFNSLIGRPGASPVSHDLRCFTTRPHLASDPSQRARLRSLELNALDPVLVDADGLRVVLVDAPDVDGARPENTLTARRVVEAADIVVYVTTHERMANFDILRELHEWAPRKRWLFVLNKADREAEPEGLKHAFDESLAKIGFHPGDEGRFLVSAVEPGRFDFERLRATVTGERSRRQVEALRLGNFLGGALDAVDPSLVEQARAMAARLAEKEESLNRRFKDSYRKGLNSPAATEALRSVVRTRIWRRLVGRVGWLMAIPVRLRSRMATVSNAFRVGVLASRGLGVLGLLGMGVASLISAAREMMPVRQVLATLGPDHRRVVAQIRADTRNTLQDLGLLDTLADRGEVAATNKPGVEATSPITAKVFEVGDAIGKLFGVGNVEPADEEVLDHLQSDMEYLAIQAATRVAVPWRNVAANFLPTLMFGHILWRVLAAWFAADYLVWSFYGMAFGLLAVTLMPGYMLFDYAVKSESNVPKVDDVVDLLTEPSVTAPLRTVRQRLEQFVHDADRLRDELLGMRKVLEEGFGTAMLGVGLDGLPTRLTTSARNGTQ